MDPEDPFDFSSDGLVYFQSDAADAARESLKRVRSTLLVLATGLGKTQVFTSVAKRWPAPVLILAHRDELVEQAAARYRAMTNLPVDYEQRGRRASPEARIVVGSVQTVQRQSRLDALGPDRFGLIIFDEAHHAPATTFRRPLEYFRSAKILGATATADRLDGQSVGQLFDEVCYQMDILKGINAGFLVPVEGRRIFLNSIDLSMVEKTAGDLRLGQLDEAMLKAAEGIVHETLKLYPLRRAIVFSPGVRSGEYMTARFNALAPDSTMFIHAGTPYWKRRMMVEDFKAGKYIRLVNCQIATEGFDCPDVDTIIMGRPTCSRALYAQMAGRGTRATPEVFSLSGRGYSEERKRIISASNKPNMLIVDFVGNSGKHDLCGPEDILGGDMEPRVIKQAKKIRKNDVDQDVLDVLKQARVEINQAAEDVISHVEATCVPFDPFRIFGIEFHNKYTHEVGHRACSPQQYRALTCLGVKPEALEGMSRKAAKALLDEFVRRRRMGLCSLKTLEVLQRHGVRDRMIYKPQAEEAMNYLKATGWGRHTDKEKLLAICRRPREMGEE